MRSRLVCNFNITLGLLCSVALVGCDATRSPSAGSSPNESPTEVASQSPATVDGSQHLANQFRPLNDPKGEPGTKFVRLDSGDTKVDFASTLDIKHPLARLYYSGFAVGGVAIGDVDNDGWPDLFLTSGPDANRMFRQISPWKFADVSATAGVDAPGVWSAGTAMADVDNDGDLDIFVCNYDSRCQLLINDGQGRFVDEASRRGIEVTDACLTPVFADYDNDGHLDLYIVKNRLYAAGGRPAMPPVQMVGGKPMVREEYAKYYALYRKPGGGYELDDVGRADQLFRNNGDGTFTDVTSAAGIRGKGQGLSATWWDFDDNGFVDLYVANDFNEPDYLFINNGDGTFTESAATKLPYMSWSSMGSDAADLDGDGFADLLVADMLPRDRTIQVLTTGAMNPAKLRRVSGPPRQNMRNVLFLGGKERVLREAAGLAEMARTDWTWAVKLADFDNDGSTDLFVTNGVVKSYNDADFEFGPEMLVGRTEWDLAKDLPPRPESNIALQNRGDLQFADVSQDWNLDFRGMSYSAAYADIDRDGDLDLVVVNLDDAVHLYRNDTQGNRGTLVRLHGRSNNSFGLGAKVELTAGGRRQIKYLSPHTGFMSSNEPLLHFGLGEAERIERLRIIWPGGRQQQLVDLPGGQLLHIVEDEATISQQPAVLAAVPLEPLTPLPRVVHYESKHSDFADQPLSPRNLASLGPGVAVGDINGDNIDDLFVGGAAGTSGTVLLGNTRGSYTRKEQDALEADRGCEDLGCVWFDLEGDGDLDLYVASGSSEFKDGDPRLVDRLYLNDGTGQLTRADETHLPALCRFTAAVCAADFDRDGDVDLFVGCRAAAARYPESAASYLLVNDGGKLMQLDDANNRLLAKAGLVTSALWSDVNQDGWIDLLVATDWGPVRCYLNTAGTFSEATADMQLATHTGLFQSIVPCDYDGDGDIDYLVGNLGLNTLYRASRESPLVCVAGDLLGSGQWHVVEAQAIEGKLWPLRPKQLFDTTMPLLSADVSTARDFSTLSLDELLGDELLHQVLQLECNTLASLVLVCDGQGQLAAVELPRSLQLAPLSGMVTTNLSGGQLCDIVAAATSTGTNPIAGATNSAAGMLLHRSHTVPGSTVAAFPIDFTGSIAGLATLATGNSQRINLVAAANNAPLQAYTAATLANEQLQIRLRGPRGNHAAYGARVRLLFANNRTQVAEVTAGQGYLSQSSPSLRFGFACEEKNVIISVTWPHGTTTEHSVDGPGSYDFSFDTAPVALDLDSGEAGGSEDIPSQQFNFARNASREALSDSFTDHSFP